MVQEKITAILTEQFDVEEDDINLGTSIEHDLHADSLDIADLLIAIEGEFDIEIDDNDIDSIETVGNIVEYVEKKIGSVVTSENKKRTIKPIPENNDMAVNKKCQKNSGETANKNSSK